MKKKWDCILDSWLRRKNQIKRSRWPNSTKVDCSDESTYKEYTCRDGRTPITNRDKKGRMEPETPPGTSRQDLAQRENTGRNNWDDANCDWKTKRYAGNSRWGVFDWWRGDSTDRWLPKRQKDHVLSILHPEVACWKWPPQKHYLIFWIAPRLHVVISDWNNTAISPHIQSPLSLHRAFRLLLSSTFHIFILPNP